MHSHPSPQHHEEATSTMTQSRNLFRPWDNKTTQDDTVSTTTLASNTLSQISQNVAKEPLVKSEHEEVNREMLQVPEVQNQERCFMQDERMAMMAAAAAASADPILLETMAQGYALEEYARVLQEEHQAKVLQARKQRPKKYKCPHCDVGFSNNGQLKGHIRIHTGERPFKCDEKECGKTFTRNEELTRHKRIHSGLRPFPCTHCGKRFGRKDHLKKHSRTHFPTRTSGLYAAVPVLLPFDTWATSAMAMVPSTSSYHHQFLPPSYGF